MGTAGRGPASTPASTPAFELRDGLAVEEVEKRLVAARRAGDLAARVLAFYLADMAERGLHQELGFGSAVRFAVERLGMGRATAREYLRVGRALEELPVVDEALRDGWLYWSHVRLLVKIATPQTAGPWVDWTRNRTVRALAAQVRGRDKGQLPTDPERRRIHGTKFTIGARVGLVTWELWNNVRAKFEAESGGPVGDEEILVELARLALTTRPDGSLPGRKPVNDRHFQVVLDHCEECRSTRVHGPDGPLPLDGDAARAALEEAGRPDLAADLGDHVRDEADAGENDGPAVLAEARDAPAPASLRDRVLGRDGRRCACCGSKKNLTVHHKRWRRFGGRSCEANLVTMCEDCHSLIHDRLLVVRGRIPGGLRFLDREGRDLSACPEELGKLRLTDGRDGESAARAASPALAELA